MTPDNTGDGALVSLQLPETTSSPPLHHVSPTSPPRLPHVSTTSPPRLGTVTPTLMNILKLFFAICFAYLFICRAADAQVWCVGGWMENDERENNPNPPQAEDQVVYRVCDNRHLSRWFSLQGDKTQLDFHNKFQGDTSFFSPFISFIFIVILLL